MTCYCQIVPAKVFEKLSKDKEFDKDQRKAFADAAAFDKRMRETRKLNAQLALMGAAMSPPSAAFAGSPPKTPMFDCNHMQALPGTPISNPAGSSDATVKRAMTETAEVANFLDQVFGRNSIDNLGMDLTSSVHYGVDFNNAFWNGFQMTYGDGDGKVFVDLTKSNDVIAHELAHGLTQYTTQLNYENEPGGLNESISDVFGSMFRQWRKGQTVDKADWLIGGDIMGSVAKARGFTCLRDMADPGAAHALAPQPKHYSKYKRGMDPHESSGIPNYAFYLAAKAIGGKSWEKAGKVWYAAITEYPPKPNMKMKSFATRTRRQAKKLFKKEPAVYKAVDDAWTAVGL